MPLAILINEAIELCLKTICCNRSINPNLWPFFESSFFFSMIIDSETRHIDIDELSRILCNATNLNPVQPSIRLSHAKTQNLKLKPKLTLFILILAFLMIAITNCSLLNPGPEQLLGSKNDKSFSVYYQNVQGLIPFTELNNKHPNLDYTKIAEIHAYIHRKHPDVIILNETWLKSSILDEEIFPINDYKVFRCDRSDFTHPKDPYNPTKFRKNGGGVLIAISSSLQVSSNIINLKCRAEIMAVKLVLEDGSKIVISTCYRVGTLGTENCNEIVCAVNKLLRKKKLKKFLLVGDFNLRNANWEINSSANNIEQMFLEEFLRLDLVQCITSPTHNKGRILDILLTNSENHLNNISIISDQQFCKSDHFRISFDVKFKIKRKRPIKIKSFNFKRANWDILNEELKSINWVSVLDSLEPDIAWLRFKNTLNYYLDLHIPKITIEINSKPPWFDVDCYQKC